MAKVKIHPGEAGLVPPFPADVQGMPTAIRSRDPHRHQEELIGRTEYNEPRTVRVSDIGEIVVTNEFFTELVEAVNDIRSLLSELVAISRGFRDGDVEESF